MSANISTIEVPIGNRSTICTGVGVDQQVPSAKGPDNIGFKLAFAAKKEERLLILDEARRVNHSIGSLGSSGDFVKSMGDYACSASRGSVGRSTSGNIITFSTWLEEATVFLFRGTNCVSPSYWGLKMGSRINWGTGIVASNLLEIIAPVVETG
ncbi:hypothetical protein ACH5RR_039989 [Cinchona calisaya]|uniref:Uncharacterized protein n=1 Tax=Cinchona calisaya TaxID=153742 RepID=A0ABD2Y1J8_9GENT